MTTARRLPADRGWRKVLQTFTPADFDDEHVPATLEHVARLAVTPTSTPFRLPGGEGVVVRQVSTADRMAAIGFLCSFVTDRADATSGPREEEDVAVSCARDVWHRYDLYSVVFALVVGSNGGRLRVSQPTTPRRPRNLELSPHYQPTRREDREAQRRDFERGRADAERAQETGIEYLPSRAPNEVGRFDEAADRLRRGVGAGLMPRRPGRPGGTAFDEQSRSSSR